MIVCDRTKIQKLSEAIKDELDNIKKANQENKSIATGLNRIRTFTLEIDEEIKENAEDASLEFSSFDEAKILTNLKHSSRSSIVTSVIQPGECEKFDATPTLRLAKCVKMIILCGGGASISEMHRGLVRAGLLNLKKSTLSANLHSWASQEGGKGYLTKIGNTISGWGISPTGLDALKIHLSAFNDIPWDKVPKINISEQNNGN